MVPSNQHKLPSSVLESTIELAQRVGWATYDGSFEEAAETATTLGYQIVPTRRRDPDVTSLRPMIRSAARPHSMSARYGLGSLPLHTDGAHMKFPPDLVILAAKSASTVGTYLMHVTEDGLPAGVSQALRHGVFLVRDGAEVRCATALGPRNELRFDPVVMTPLDDLARTVVRYFETVVEVAEVRPWKDDDVLVIDNTAVVHGRQRADAAPRRELRRVMLRKTT